MDQNQIETLIAAGRHADAAAAARAAGDLARAQSLYESIWDFASAAAIARTRGDRVAELKNLVDAKAWADVDDRVRALAGGAPEAVVRAAASLLEARRLYAAAAILVAKLGEDERAAALYARGGQLLDAAKLYEKIGKHREAGRLLEQLVADPPDDPHAAAEAHLTLGRVCARVGNHEAAVRHLQIAGKAGAPAAGRLLVVELAAMGLSEAAAEALGRARALDPSLPATVADFLASAEPARRELVGGRYRLGRLLGAGGSGRVYLADDELAGRPVAVKLFQPGRGDAFERFVREARVWGRTKHRNLVPVIELREDLGFAVMELMAGTLADQLTPRLAPAAVRRMLLDLLAGLGHAHARGVVHRDLKPANVFFDAHGVAKLGDFGAAHLLDVGQTQTGGLIGTLAYMAPEQITGAPITVAADFYALGVTTFLALTGRLPFLGPDFVAQHLGDAPPRPSELDPALADWDALLAALLAKDPGARPAGAEEVRALVEAIDVHAGREVLSMPRGKLVPEAAPAPAAPIAEPGPRFVGETPLGETSISTLARAVDAVLGRSVIVERFADGQPDEPTRARLFALAAAPGPHLQRALSFVAGAFIAEAPVGEPLAQRREPFAEREAARLLVALGRALAPLHAAGRAHGAIGPERVLVDDDGVATLLVCGLGPATGAETPGEDIRACLALVGRDGDPPDLFRHAVAWEDELVQRAVASSTTT